MEEKLSEKIYNSIRNDIITGVIDDRTFLTERDLSRRFGVSKAPVRDALHLLCNQEYLVSYPRRGYMVCLCTQEDIAQMHQIRAHLEQLCIRLAIQNASDEEILSLRSISLQDDSNADPESTNNMVFHMRLARLSHNKYLPVVLSDLLRKTSRYWIGPTAKRASSQPLSFPIHEQIVDALLARDEQLAITYLLNDLEMSV